LAEFVAAENFTGAKKGYVFKAGTAGVGYYKDTAAEEEGDDSDEEDAAPAAAAAAAAAAGPALPSASFIQPRFGASAVDDDLD